MKRITSAAAAAIAAPAATALRSKPPSTIRSSLTRNSTQRQQQQPRKKKVSVEVLWMGVLVVIVLCLTYSVVVMFSTLPEKPSESASPILSRQYHMVFSTSCDPFQDWQSLAFFYFALRIQQPGHITRIVSGCTPEQAQARQLIHEQKIAPLDPQHFHLHVTPNYNHGLGNLKYWNKPFGLLSYFETELGYSNQVFSTPHDNDVVIILDPDMMLLKPITDDFSNYLGEWKNDLTHTTVQHGQPIAQRYEYGDKWLSSLKDHVVDVVGPDSPVLKINLTQADLYYPAGPPYLATAKDMYQIVTHWVKFLPKVYEYFPEFMAEMHGYSVAAAHLKLPHRLARNLMISTVASFEDFDFVDTTLNRTNACEAGAAAASSTSERGIIPTVHLTVAKLPYVLHYCQRYALGRFFFSKYKLNEQFFDCDAPLMREPPINVGDLYDWNIFPNGVEMWDMSRPDKHSTIARNGWMMCSLIFGLNDAATSFKQKHCTNPNLEKTWHFHDETLFQQMLDDPSNPFQNGKINTITAKTT